MNLNDMAITEKTMRMPTAPFREQLVREHIVGFCRARGMHVHKDGIGNVIARFPNPAGPMHVLALAAHMDHPGFIVRRNTGKGQASAVFYGRVEPEYFKDAPVRVFTADGPVRGRVAAQPRKASPSGLNVRLAVEGHVNPGDTAMWDVAPFQVRGDTLTARACDDLAGVAAMLAFADRMARQPVHPSVMLVFTTAEEGGLHGAIHLCRKKFLPPQAMVVSVEASREGPVCRRGDGVVIRVGDRVATFDPRLLAFMEHAAEATARHDRTFRFQRKLMDGGRCESSVFQEFGYRSAGVCLPLGNYHNRDFKRGRIAPEKVSIADLRNMGKLFDGLSKALPEAGRFLRPARPRYRIERGPHGERFQIPR